MDPFMCRINALQKEQSTAHGQFVNCVDNRESRPALAWPGECGQPLFRRPRQKEPARMIASRFREG
jgi:hypothetical protein